VGLDLRLDYDRGIPIYRQIYEAVVDALSGGGLDRGEQLPTIHELAGRIEVNPNTVARAYRELERDGYIIGKRGVGTFSTDAALAEAPPRAESPPPAEKPPPAERERVLRGIFERAWAEAARYRIGVDELREYFRKALP
jgi:GntR family transcriptional regulator